MDGMSRKGLAIGRVKTLRYHCNIHFSSYMQAICQVPGVQGVDP